MMHKILLALLVFNLNISYSQRIISGLVADETGMPIGGVTVSSANDKVKSYTNNNGEYSILLPENEKKLRFSKKDYVEKTIDIDNSGVINVTMTLVQDINLYNLSFEELKNIKVAIATKTEKSIREVPSAITVITANQIQTYGARDLADVLRMVPGFDFGIDVNQLIGSSYRGAWVHEGKMALMINGITVNEYAYGNLNLLGNYPVNMVEKIEIIRGPGSVLYGGFSEVCIVNIVTYKGKKLDGVKIAGDIGVMGEQVITRNISLSSGIEKNDLEVSVHLGAGTNQMSTKTYTPYIQFNSPFFNGPTLSSIQLNSENAFRNPYHVIIDSKHKGLKTNFVLNSFTYGAQSTWYVRPKIKGQNGETRNNTTLGFQSQYEWMLTPKLKLTPLIEYTQSNPVTSAVYPLLSDQGTYRNDNVVMHKEKAELIVQYKDNYLVGGGFWIDNIKALTSNGGYGLALSNNPADTTDHISANTIYFIAQYTSKYRNLGFTSALRVETTKFGDAIVPRLALTYIKDKLNLKLLYIRSYRIPMLFQAYSRALDVGEVALQPEIANNYEIETGYKLSKNINAQLNFFHIKIIRPIVYGFLYQQSIEPVEAYLNYGILSSIGAEGEISAYWPNSGGFINFSYTRPLENTTISFCSTDKKSFLGMAPVKIGAGYFHSIKSINISPSFTFLSKRSGVTKEYANNVYSSATPAEIPFEDQKYDAVFLLNFNVTTGSLFKKITFNFTCYNILNTDYKLIQPYYDTHAPIPVWDRHFVLSMDWDI